MNDRVAVTKYINLAERASRPKKSAQQQYWEDRADALYLLTKKQMVVIDNGNDHYQVWNKSIADKCGAEYIYVTKGGNDNANL